MRILFGGFVVLLGLLVSGCATPESTLMAGGDGGLLSSPGFGQIRPTVWEITGDVPHEVTVVPCAQAGWPTALQVKGWPADGQEHWQLGLMQKLTGNLEEGDKVQLKVWLRSPDSAKVALFLEETWDPWTKLAYQELTVGPEWQEVTIAATLGRGYSEGALEVGFHLGYGEQTVELTGARLLPLK